MSWAVPLLLVGACAGSPRQSARYVGPAPACARGEGGQSTLARHGDGFAFAPTDGSLVVRGTIAADGTLAGSLPLRPASGGPGEQSSRTPAAPRALQVGGTLDPETATVAYAAPGCTATVTLKRVHPPLL